MDGRRDAVIRLYIWNRTLSEMNWVRHIPGPEERCRWYNFLWAPENLLRSPSRLEAVINGSRAEKECRKMRLFYAAFTLER